MKVWFALCGNSYSQSLFQLAAPDSVIKLSHRSNAGSVYEKLLSVVKIFFAVFLRFGCAITRGEFLMCVPHNAGNYQKLLKLLRPTNVAVIDDGITFEYWSVFHERTVKPILLDERCKLLIGPRKPSWPLVMYMHCTLLQRSRSSVVGAMLRADRLGSGWTDLKKADSFVFVDDGRFSIAQIELISNFLKKEYGVTVLVVAHPTRKLNSHSGVVRLQIPVEHFVLELSTGLVGVLGKGSTALFNIAAASHSLLVLSLRTGVEALDASMEQAGIKLIAMESLDVV